MRLQLPNLRCTIKLKGVIFNSASKAFLLSVLGERGLDALPRGAWIEGGEYWFPPRPVYGGATDVFGKTEGKKPKLSFICLVLHDENTRDRTEKEILKLAGFH